ncbi:polysialyltransferase family glycosyltransferase [Pontibacter sp. 13R65]|uniref:polysialyltransferase family glycosyltransferase n=1 Tax=Pontibacter sp. 13R65 TaxID=3127458 RepID=UPI00301BB819
MANCKPSNKTILFIGDYNRTDYVSLLKSCKDIIRFTFLNFSSVAEETNSYYKEYGNAVYWKDFKDAYELLKKIKPFKVVFLYIESYHHVALNVACKKLVIPTYLLEHGMRADYNIAFDPEMVCIPKVSFYQKLRTFINKINQFSARFKSKLFLNRTIRHSTPEDAAFLRTFISTRRKYNFLVTFKKIKDPKRLADYYISFSSKVFEIHRTHESLTSDQKVHFIGVPYFDKLAGMVEAQKKRNIIFIDQPLAENQLLGWTKESKEQFAKEFIRMCQQANYNLFIKPHPLQDLSMWQEQAKKNKITLITDGQLKASLPFTPVIIGFYSTYLMPLAAMRHTTLLTLENHPAGPFNVSKPFVEAGVSHPVYLLEELPQLLSEIDIIHQKQINNKNTFANDWLYIFDGKSGDRLKAILLS